jgi:putative ABC transport system substrate-binding protein
MRVAARSLGVQLLSFEVKTAEDIETAFASARREGAHGLVAYQDALTHAHLTKIAALALKHRLPLAAGDRRWAEAGALISFAPDWWAELRRTAHYVDRILKGANPATLPVEEPMRFEIVVNLKTAKTLGVTIPQSVLVRADKVID